VPEALREPGLHLLRVAENQPFDGLTSQVLALVQVRPRPLISAKDEEITAMVNRGAAGVVVTLINYASRVGSVCVALPGGRYECLLDSGRLTGKRVELLCESDHMMLRLQPRAAFVLRIPASPASDNHVNGAKSNEQP
jgi:hypothetical protein